MTNKFLEEYCIFIVKSMYKNIDAALLRIRLMAKYLVNKCNLKRSTVDSCILFGKYEKGKLELVMSVHVDNVFIYGNPRKLKNIKEKIKEKFNISESRKSRSFLEFIMNGVMKRNFLNHPPPPPPRHAIHRFLGSEAVGRANTDVYLLLYI